MKKLNILRVPPEVELMGLDVAEYEPNLYLPEVAVAERDARGARRDAGGWPTTGTEKPRETRWWSRCR